jgi:ketosteroid isomerase-like protein
MSEKVQVDVAANNARLCAAVVARDMGTLVELYDPEVVVLVPGAAPIRGHDGVQAYYENVFTAGVTRAEMRTVVLTEVGDTFAEIGEYTMDLEPAGGERVTSTGKYMVVHRRQSDGALALWLDMVQPDALAR